MGTHEENNMQQEIIDSMAKKVTDLEKRQSKIEELGLSALPSKVKELESKVTETANTQTLENTKQLERFDKQLNGFDEKINAIPKEIPIKYNVQFDTKSKFIIRTILGLGLAGAIMLAVSICLWIENSRRADETNKFLILRGFYPNVAKYIDTAYISNADFLIKKAKANIDEQQTMSEAAFEAKQAAEESKMADEKLMALKRKNQPVKKTTKKTTRPNPN
ncbi:hypothetical protein IDJ77_11950 [Mucilaginibacter sp. ZT4R22]|uniref:Uncharacterized protein n=1 Tax=Mucilaginibacter pankratovii TaxID=2772110 RepID=A0ABR7WQC6_9SPHI|nr:hypothetical protein [Mucilaginibacter pankratovii]MBD1364523.1 hypothetical protein [Mucilaginibacter pankratovii]